MQKLSVNKKLFQTLKSFGVIGKQSTIVHFNRKVIDNLLNRQVRGFSSCQFLKSTVPPSPNNPSSSSSTTPSNTTPSNSNQTPTTSESNTQETVVPPVVEPPKRSKYYDEDLGRELTETEIKSKQNRRKLIYAFLFLAAIGGLITLALYKAMMEIQNLSVFSDMVETLFINNDKELVYN